MEEESSKSSSPKVNNENQNSIGNSDQLKEILRKIKILSDSERITHSNAEFKQYIKQWEDILSEMKDIDPEIEKEYKILTEQYQKNYDWALWANFKIKEEICDELEIILKDEKKITLVDKFDSLRNKWKRTGNVPAEKSKELWARYRNLCKSVHEKVIFFFEDNLKIKVALCEKIENLTSPDNWYKATKFVQDAQKNWNSIGPVLRKDSEDIWKRFQSACNLFFKSQKLYFKEVKNQQKENLHNKKQMCIIVESFIESTNWKETSIKIHEIQKQWKLIGSVGKKYEDQIWSRFKKACDTFFLRQKEYFDQIDKQRPLNLEKKQELCKQLENMDDLSDDEKYEFILNIQSKWKEIGPIPKEFEAGLWQRFRKPIDEYFESRKAKYETEKKYYEDHLQSKINICKTAESLMYSDDWQATKEQLKDLQKKWNTIGKVPKEKEKEIWQQFKKACDTFFERLNEHRDDLKYKFQENLKNKIDLCFQAEIIAGIELNPKDAEERANWQFEKLSENFWYKIIDDDSWEAKVNKIKELQKTWKQIGPVPKNRSQEIWERFQKACNRFFERRSDT